MKLKGTMWSLLVGALMAFAGQSAYAADAKCGLNTGKPATGTPIPVGGIVSITGPDNFSFSGFAAKAYFDCVNANGGINGRPIKYDMLDDGWNPEQASQDAAKLINDEKVVALVGNMSFVDCGANQGAYEKADVMVVAGVGVPRDCFFQKNYVTTNAGPRVSNTKTLMSSRQAIPQHQALRLLCAEHPQCRRMVLRRRRWLDQAQWRRRQGRSCSIPVRSMRHRWCWKRWRSSPT